MSADEPTRLGIEVRFDAEPIVGRVYDGGPDAPVPAGRRTERAFSGWLGLIAAIEAARAGRAPRQTKGDAG